MAKLLTREGISADRIHGNRSQGQRTRALADFKAGKCRVLVATDIAARGIDVVSLGHVVNFDIPAAPEDYVHRVGRIARAEATGEALTLVAPEDEDGLGRIERIVGSKLPRIRLEGFEYKGADHPLREVPHAERVAAIRARRSADRARANERKKSLGEQHGGNLGVRRGRGRRGRR